MKEDPKLLGKNQLCAPADLTWEKMQQAFVTAQEKAELSKASVAATSRRDAKPRDDDIYMINSAVTVGTAAPPKKIGDISISLGRSSPKHGRFEDRGDVVFSADFTAKALVLEKASVEKTAETKGQILKAAIEKFSGAIEGVFSKNNHARRYDTACSATFVATLVDPVSREAWTGFIGGSYAYRFDIDDKGEIADSALSYQHEKEYGFLRRNICPREDVSRLPISYSADVTYAQPPAATVVTSIYITASDGIAAVSAAHIKKLIRRLSALNQLDRLAFYLRQQAYFTPKKDNIGVCSVVLTRENVALIEKDQHILSFIADGNSGSDYIARSLKRYFPGVVAETAIFWQAHYQKNSSLQAAFKNFRQHLILAIRHNSFYMDTRGQKNRRYSIFNGTVLYAGVNELGRALNEGIKDFHPIIQKIQYGLLLLHVQQAEQAKVIHGDVDNIVSALGLEPSSLRKALDLTIAKQLAQERLTENFKRYEFLSVDQKENFLKNIAAATTSDEVARLALSINKILKYRQRVELAMVDKVRKDHYKGGHLPDTPALEEYLLEIHGIKTKITESDIAKLPKNVLNYLEEYKNHYACRRVELATTEKKDEILASFGKLQSQIKEILAIREAQRKKGVLPTIRIEPPLKIEEVDDTLKPKISG